jgi:hypothetical protein
MSSENIRNNSGGAQEKGKRGSKQDETQFTTKKMVLDSPLVECYCTFLLVP